MFASILRVSGLFLWTSRSMSEATGGWLGWTNCLWCRPHNCGATKLGVPVPSTIRLGEGLRCVARKDWQRAQRLIVQ